MKLNDFIEKEYSMPLNIPPQSSYKYLEIIEKGYAKYLEVIDLCGKFIMYQQFNSLVEHFEPTLTKAASRERVARLIIKRLIELGFVDSSNINKNKFLYLKKPSFSFSVGDYINSSRVNLGNDIKNDKFQISILKIEYLLKYGEALHSNTMFAQLKEITRHIYSTIIKQGNNYGYSLNVIERILQLDDYLEIINYINENPEYKTKLGIIRGLWVGVGSLFRKMLLQKQTVTEKPEHYKLFVKKDGEVILHYIPNIIIFDVAHDKKYYRERSVKLFHAFYEIENNELRDVQQNYIKDKSSMGFSGQHHIGYKITLIGSNKSILMQKKLVIDEDINASPNSPLMDYTSIFDLEIGRYTLHASRLGNSYQEKQDIILGNAILGQLERIKGLTNKSSSIENSIKDNKDTEKASAAQRILDLVSGE